MAEKQGPNKYSKWNTTRRSGTFRSHANNINPTDVQGDKAVRFRKLSRRGALQTAAALLTVSVSARSLGLSASAKVPEKIVLGTVPIIPQIASYIGEVD